MIHRKLFTNFVFFLAASLSFGFALWFFIPDQSSKAADLPEINRDLTRTFRGFQLLKLNTEETLAQVRHESKIILPFSDKNLEIVLQKNDLRSANYRAQTTNADGTRKVLPKDNEIRTYKGKITGEGGSKVRLSISGNKIEGYVFHHGKQMFIEPARKYSASAAADDFVVYEAKDIVQTLDFTCETDLSHKIGRTAQKYFAPANLGAMPPLQVHEIATEADFDYVSFLGGATQANNEILDILNMIEGVYESELNLTFSVTFQHAWSTPDPFQANSSPLVFINSFQNYWNANFPVSQFPRDAAHLWTNKPNFAGTNARGVAFVGVVCRSQFESYSLAGRRNEDFAFAINYLLAAHEIGHTFNASHAEAPDACADTIMNAIVSNVTPMTFCNFSGNQISGYVAQHSGCLSTQTAIVPTRNDFDGDGKADISLFRPTNALWYVSRSANNIVSTTQWGISTDKIVPADFDGDGKTDYAVFRAGFWYILTAQGTFQGAQWGNAGDIPLPFDFDGDNKDDLGVFRAGNWFVLKSSGGNVTQNWGNPGDIPFVEDFDGDNKADYGVYRNGIWYVLQSTQGATVVQWGIASDKVVPADYNGDEKADFAVFRDGFWYILLKDGGFQGAQWGATGDIPAPADYDGDGKTDLAIFRNGTWFIQRTTAGVQVVNFGNTGDKPAANAFVP